MDYPPVRAEGAFQAPQRFGRKRGFWETEHVGCHQPQLNNNKRTRGDAAAGAAEGVSTRGVGRGERQHASLDHGAAAGPVSSDSLRQQLQECQVLLQNAVRENGILKKAVAIQNDREVRTPTRTHARPEREDDAQRRRKLTPDAPFASFFLCRPPCTRSARIARVLWYRCGERSGSSRSTTTRCVRT